MHIAICDDEQIIRDLVVHYCLEYKDKNETEFVISEYPSGEELLKVTSMVDLLFLDIELGGINGIDVKNIVEKKDNIASLVFVSGYKDLVWEAFGKKTLGFIKKPFQYKDISIMLEKYFRMKKKECFINIQTNGSDYPVKVSSIIYIKAMNYYTEVLTNNQSYSVRESLTEWESKLKDYHFYRIHRSYLVNMDYIKKIYGTEVRLENGERLKVGRNRLLPLKKILFEYTINQDY